MKFSFTCMNTYYRPEAMANLFKATPRALWDPEFGKQTGEEALKLSALADELGFDYVSVSEHHYQAGMCNPNASVLAAALTQVVKRAKIALLGPLVSITNPVRVAEEIAMLDQLSGGRFITLLLRGTPNEFANYNVPAEETRGRTEEAMLLIKKALTEPEPFSWKGEYYDFPVISVWPGPTQVPHPPMYGSANSQDSLTFAAKNGFGAAMSYFGPKMVAQNMAAYREACRANGWEPTPDQQLFRAFCVVGEDEAHAEQLKARFHGAGGSRVPGPPPGGPKGGVPSTDSTSVVDQAGFGFGLLQFVGDAPSLVDQIREFHANTGVGVLDLSFNFGFYSYEETVEQLRRFARDVIPKVRDLSSVPA